MKLSKHIYKEIIKVWFGPDREKEAQDLLTEDDVEEWIVEWYRGEFKEVGCDGSVAKPRMPPSWLAQWRRNEKV